MTSVTIIDIMGIYKKILTKQDLSSVSFNKDFLFNYSVLVLRKI